MSGRYRAARDSLKKNKTVTLKCRPEKMKTIVACMRKEKCLENAPRHALEVASFGVMKVSKKVVDGVGFVTFKLVSSFKSYEL